MAAAASFFEVHDIDHNRTMTSFGRNPLLTTASMNHPTAKRRADTSVHRVGRHTL
ncbi:hypothetical protein CC2G_007991 [Coprinopsis cinerea AmutBmut pab1-1]|nr:hypothetical protein CC2G_007991 [Coprinopsis cinerea AmutBmut pab1-1]